MHSSEAQRARFEHGENGKPKPYVDTLPNVSVYVAGSVLEGKEEDIVQTSDEQWANATAPVMKSWRKDICGETKSGIDINEQIESRFFYAGPTILLCHGCCFEGPPVATTCIEQVSNSDVVFAWIDGVDTIGTLAEIGAAYSLKKPIFIAFLNKELSEHFYFIQQIATLAVIASDAVTAWKFFTAWQNW